MTPGTGEARGKVRQQWAMGLAALILAVSPVAVLALRPPGHSPEPALAPGIIAGNVPAKDSSPLEAPAEAPPAPADTTLSAEAQPLAEAGRSGPCALDAVPAAERNRCLYDTIRTSELALEAELANALRVIDARSDLAPVQRNRWKSLLDEAQSRYLLYRNFDCQSVAPFEGKRGIGNFEERALCLITANTRRAEALASRYVLPPAEMERAVPDGPAPQAGTWTHATPQVLD